MGSDETRWIAEGLAISLSEASTETKGRVLYRQMRDWIQSRQLPVGARLPSSRSLARDLGVGRNTVLGAVDQLIAEGFLEARPGAGVFVVDSVFSSGAPVKVKNAEPALQLSSRGQSLLALGIDRRFRSLAFEPGVPALDQFPWDDWRRLLRRHYRRAEVGQLNYQSNGGHAGLRRAIADYVRLARGVVCEADQILITRGAQHAFDLIARLLTDPGEVVWVEEPGYLGVKAAWRAANLSIVPLPVDGQGAHVEAVAEQTRKPKLIYVTPSHQYPLGSTMAMARRKALIDAAHQHGAWIIEDDYDSEFRYDAEPLSSLQGMAAGGPVLYVGTFSKTLYPGLRLGFVVLPKSAIAAFQAVNARVFREGDYITQAALAEFLTAGHFARHVGRMRRCYAERRERILDVLQPAKQYGLSLHGDEAGLHLLAKLPTRGAEDRLRNAGQEHQLHLSPLSAYYDGRPKMHGLVLGYGGVKLDEIQPASRVIVDTLARLGQS